MEEEKQDEDLQLRRRQLEMHSLIKLDRFLSPAPAGKGNEHTPATLPIRHLPLHRLHPLRSFRNPSRRRAP